MTSHSRRYDDPSLDRVEKEFQEQAFMSYLGATVMSVGVGRMRVTFDVRPQLTQNHGFVHAGVLTSVMDTTAGFAAMTLLDAHQSILTADFSVNLLRPALGTRVVVDADVLKRGRTLIVGRASATAVRTDSTDDDQMSGLAPCAVLTGTFSVVVPRLVDTGPSVAPPA